MNNTPRRIRLDKNEPAELAIRNAVNEIELIGADVRLTKAVNLLHEARELVADFIDNLPALPEPPSSQQKDVELKPEIVSIEEKKPTNFQDNDVAGDENFYKEEYRQAVNEIGQLQEQLKEAEQEIRDLQNQLNSD